MGILFSGKVGRTGPRKYTFPMSIAKIDKTLEIPVKPHVLQFLIHQDNLGLQDTMPVRKDHWIGELLTSVFSFHPLNDDELGVDYLPAIASKYPVLKVRPSFKVNLQLVTDRHLAKVGASLEVMFKHALIYYVRGRLTVIGSVQGAVKKFYEEYEISSLDYDFDSAFKVVQRSFSDNVTKKPGK